MADRSAAYKAAGVDIDAGNSLVSRIKSIVAGTYGKGVLSDIGGFGVSSDITWQAMASLGYHVSDKGSVGLGYRALGTDYTSGSSTYDVISHGLLLGFEYKF